MMESYRKRSIGCRFFQPFSSSFFLYREGLTNIPNSYHARRATGEMEVRERRRERRKEEQLEQMLEEGPRRGREG